MITMTYEIKANVTEEFAEILTDDAMDFIVELEENFGGKILELLAHRVRCR